MAAITGVEVVATVARKQKGGGVSAPDAAAMLSQFRSDFASSRRIYRVIAISDAIINRAMALGETHALRGYDAVQLAAVMDANARRLALGAPPLPLITADLELLAAGITEGLLTDNPDTH